MEFNQYFPNEAIESALREWVEQHPSLIQLRQIGSSHENRPIWLAVLTNTGTGPDTTKPAVWLDGNIHATELAGSTTVLYLIHSLLESYGKDERITRLLDECVFYAVPRINPDGANAALSQNPRFLRSGIRPYPWLELPEGLHQQDIDGDGRILQMRIEDPNGDWKIGDADPRFLIKRSPEEMGGTYYRLLPEGLIENFDGYKIELARPAAGLDFNRNFPFDWKPESDQTGAGPYPASEPEIGAVVKFIAEHPNISFALTFHTFGRVLLRPYSTKPDDQMERPDLEVFKTLGAIGTRHSGYRNVSTYHDFTYDPKHVTTGAFDDWMYDVFGAFVWTIELWDLPTEAGIKDRKWIEWFDRHPVEEDYQILQWVDEHVGPQGYVDWRPFDHPQLGRVELGGWNSLYTWRNPPHAFMSAEAQRHLPFVLTLGDLLPHLALHTLKALQAGENVWTVDLVVENTGYLPTYTSRQGQKRLCARPVTAELRLAEGMKIRVGKPRMSLGHLEGRAGKDSAASVFGYSSTDNRGHVQWVIEAPADTKLEITIHSERAGEIRRTIILTSQGAHPISH